MGLFKTLHQHVQNCSVVLNVTSAKEGKITVMIYPTNTKEDEPFIPVTITEQPEVLDDNIEDILSNSLKNTIDRFISESQVSSTTPASKRKSKSSQTKTSTKSKEDEKKEKPTAPTGPSLFDQQVEEKKAPEKNEDEKAPEAQPDPEPAAEVPATEEQKEEITDTSVEEW